MNLYHNDAQEVLTLLAGTTTDHIAIAATTGAVLCKDGLFAEVDKHIEASRETGNKMMRDGLGLLRAWLERNIATSPLVPYGYLPWYEANEAVQQSG
jgi:hypothetical protein